jgi:hypothetical protein
MPQPLYRPVPHKNKSGEIPVSDHPLPDSKVMITLHYRDIERTSARIFLSSVELAYQYVDEFTLRWNKEKTVVFMTEDGFAVVACDLIASIVFTTIELNKPEVKSV